nr:MAG TPA: Ribosome, translation, release factor [Caudoviricetes sp.]
MTAHAAQCGCGVHGFAMNPCESRPDSNRALLS